MRPDIASSVKPSVVAQIEAAERLFQLVTVVGVRYPRLEVGARRHPRQQRDRRRERPSRRSRARACRVESRPHAGVLAGRHRVEMQARDDVRAPARSAPRAEQRRGAARSPARRAAPRGESCRGPQRGRRAAARRGRGQVVKRDVIARDARVALGPAANAARGAEPRRRDRIDDLALDDLVPAVVRRCRDDLVLVVPRREPHCRARCVQRVCATVLSLSAPASRRAMPEPELGRCARRRLERAKRNEARKAAKREARPRAPARRPLCATERAEHGDERDWLEARRRGRATARARALRDPALLRVRGRGGGGRPAAARGTSRARCSRGSARACARLRVEGRARVAPEGLNCNLSGAADAVRAYCRALRAAWRRSSTRPTSSSRRPAGARSSAARGRARASSRRRRRGGRRRGRRRRPPATRPPATRPPATRRPPRSAPARSPRRRRRLGGAHQPAGHEELSRPRPPPPPPDDGAPVAPAGAAPPRRRRARGRRREALVLLGVRSAYEAGRPPDVPGVKAVDPRTRGHRELPRALGGEGAGGVLDAPRARVLMYCTAACAARRPRRCSRAGCARPLRATRGGGGFELARLSAASTATSRPSRTALAAKTTSSTVAARAAAAAAGAADGGGCAAHDCACTPAAVGLRTRRRRCRRCNMAVRARSRGEGRHHPLRALRRARPGQPAGAATGPPAAGSGAAARAGWSRPGACGAVVAARAAPGEQAAAHASAHSRTRARREGRLRGGASTTEAAPR